MQSHRRATFCKLKLCTNLDLINIKKDPGEPGFKGHPIEFMIILDKFGQIWCHLEQFGALWTNLDAIGPIESVIFLAQEVARFFVTRGCVIFLSREVA